MVTNEYNGDTWEKRVQMGTNTGTEDIYNDTYLNSDVDAERSGAPQTKMQLQYEIERHVYSEIRSVDDKDGYILTHIDTQRRTLYEETPKDDH